MLLTHWKPFDPLVAIAVAANILWFRGLGLHVELPLQAGEEPKALKSSGGLNSTADAARSGSSRSDGVQT